MHATTVTGSTTPRRDRTRLVVAGAMALAGAIWTLQGLGAPIGGSFMVGDPFWILAGAVLILASVGYGLWPRLRRR